MAKHRAVRIKQMDWKIMSQSESGRAIALSEELSSSGPVVDSTSNNRKSRKAVAFLVIGIIFVGLDLRPGIGAIGPVMSTIREHFSLSHAVVSMLVSIPDLLMGILALPTPWL